MANIIDRGFVNISPMLSVLKYTIFALFIELLNTSLIDGNIINKANPL